MATRPTVGGSDGTWGDELNTYLDVSLDTAGKVDDGAAQTTSAAPAADAELANKKYVDDNTTMIPAITGAGTGYAGEESITFSNGLILKIGQTDNVDNGDTITFGTPFPTGRVSVNFVKNDTSANKTSVTTFSTSSFIVKFDGDNNKTIYWQAWGY